MNEEKKRLMNGVIAASITLVLYCFVYFIIRYVFSILTPSFMYLFDNVMVFGVIFLIMFMIYYSISGKPYEPKEEKE